MDQITPPPTAGLEILKTGKHVSEDGRVFTFTEADLQQIADNYDPALFEAPIVVGHPSTNDPAYGWARSLFMKDGSLFAEPHQVEPQFAEIANAGRFKKISPSIYLPDTPGNPKKGQLYLKHIGMLGAAAPAIKGMRPASFNEADGEGPAAACFSMPLRELGWNLTELFDRIRDWLLDKEGVEVADRVIPRWQIRAIGEHTRENAPSNSPISYAAPAAKPTTTENLMSQQQNQPDAAAFAEREQALKAQTDALATREQAIAKRETDALRADAAAFAEQLVADGKLLPRQKAGVIELLVALPATTALNFAEGETTVSKPAADVLREVLSAAAPVVNFKEKSGDSQVLSQPANFAAPRGAHVDTSRMELHSRALEYQAAHPNVSYAGAVAAVGG